MEIRPGVLRTQDSCFTDLPDWPFAPHYVEVPDERLGPLRMHYIDEGEPNAPVVLMLHGNPTWSYLYRHMIGPVVAAGYRVIAPDLIGFGRSDKPARREDYGVDRFVMWIRHFVEALDLTGATLVCQDWGGPIGLRVVAGDPDRFVAVLATNTLLPNCDPPPLGPADWPGEQIEAWIETCRTVDDLPLENLVSRACVKRPADDVLAAYAAPYPDKSYKAGMLQITCGIPIADGQEGLQANRAAWDFLEGWDRPFLTAFSDGDPATIAWEALFQARVAGAKGQPHTRIAGAGHFVQEEQGGALAKVLVEFLEQNRASV